MGLQCARCGCGMRDTAPNCPTCGNPNEAAAAAATAPADAVQSPGIPGLPAPAPTPGIPGLPAPAPTAGIPGLPTPAGGIPGLQNPAQQQPVPNHLNPNAQMGGLGGAPVTSGGEIRVSLTGEVYEVPPPSPRGAGPGGFTPSGGHGGASPPLPTRRGAAPPPPRRGTGPVGAGAARPRHGGPAVQEEEEKSGGVPIWALALALLVLGGAAFGWFTWSQKQQAPKLAAQKATDALVAQNWNALYDNIYFPPEIENMLKQAGDPKAVFAMGMTMNASTGKLKFSDPQYGAVTITGDTATVSVTVNLEQNGQSKSETEDMPMKLVNGTWKLDASKGFRLGGTPAGLGGGSGLTNSGASLPGR